jgi:hypothetical protein
MNEIQELITALRTGTMTLDEVARRFRERRWPRRRSSPPRNYMELAKRAQEDPEPDVPGSFDEVDAAYDLGQLTDDQYDVLAEAAAESMRAEDRHAR